MGDPGTNVVQKRVKTSRFRGVRLLPNTHIRKRWRAEIQFNGRRYVLGDFEEEETAAAVYDIVAGDLKDNFQPNLPGYSLQEPFNSQAKSSCHQIRVIWETEVASASCHPPPGASCMQITDHVCSSNSLVT